MEEQGEGDDLPSKEAKSEEIVSNISAKKLVRQLVFTGYGGVQETQVKSEQPQLQMVAQLLAPPHLQRQSLMPPVSAQPLRSIQAVKLESPRVRPRQNNEVKDSSTPKKQKQCNCKNSRCLKLYCECFATGMNCNMCNCVNCHNNIENEAVRQEAVETILERNPDAFKPKVASSPPAAQDRKKEVVRHSKGCHCKKSACLKKYCECFHANIRCSENCKCIDCKNFQGSEEKEALERVEKAKNIVPLQQVADYAATGPTGSTGYGAPIASNNIKSPNLSFGSKATRDVPLHTIAHSPEESVSSKGLTGIPDEDYMYVSFHHCDSEKELRPQSTSASHTTSAHALAKRQRQVLFLASARHTSGGSTSQPIDAGETTQPVKSFGVQMVQLNNPQDGIDSNRQINPSGPAVKTSTSPSLAHVGAPRSLSMMGLLLQDTTIEPHLRETLEFYHRLHPEMLQEMPQFSSFIVRDAVLTTLGKVLHGYKKLMFTELDTRRYQEIVGAAKDLERHGLNLSWMVDRLSTFWRHMCTPPVSDFLLSGQAISNLSEKLKEAEATVAELRAQIDVEEKKKGEALDAMKATLGVDLAYMFMNGIGEETNMREADACGRDDAL